MSRFSQDPYETLGIPRDATDSQIRMDHRRRAMRFHPDRNPDDPEAEERFKQVQWAYENLTPPLFQSPPVYVTASSGP